MPKKISTAPFTSATISRIKLVKHNIIMIITFASLNNRFVTTKEILWVKIIIKHKTVIAPNIEQAIYNSIFCASRRLRAMVTLRSVSQMQPPTNSMASSLRSGKQRTQV